jgi:hypothetical protein
MKYLQAKIMKWKIKKSTEKYSRTNKFSNIFVDVIYENDFEMAKILIGDGKVDVNIKYDCRDTPLIAVCQQTPLQSEEEAVTQESMHKPVNSMMAFVLRTKLCCSFV